jgi:multisubunit Na+/H+ antiporter MnhB subunit
MTDGFVWFDLILMAGAVTVALLTLLTRSLLNAVVLFIVFGLLLGIAWGRLNAVDIALAEVAIGAGVTGALLFNTLVATGMLSSKRRRAGLQAGKQAAHGMPEINGEVSDNPMVSLPESRFSAAATFTHRSALLSTAAGMFLLLTLVFIPLLRSSGGSRIDLSEVSEQGGADNVVTAVLLNFRAYDTLLEVAVMLAAIFASLTVVRRSAVIAARPIGPVQGTYLRMVLPTAIVIGAYVLWTGTKAPGGAFQAAAIMGAAGVLLLVSGVAPPNLSRRRWRIVIVFGISIFVVIALVCLFLGRQFLEYRAGLAGTAILLIETALTISIALVLVMLFAFTAPDEPDAAATVSGAGSDEREGRLPA